MTLSDFSVLMSLYEKERPEFLSECLESLASQTVIPNEIVIVFDGPLSTELERVVDSFAQKTNLIRKVRFAENRGLGPALADGLLACRYPLVARMDTDDIARKDRFEVQLRTFLENEDLDICGSHILEFDDDKNKVISKRAVPICHDDIVSFQRKRSAFNHMTVMYKKKAVIRAGNYEDCPLMEDDLLWSRMILSGARCANIDDTLVYARANGGMLSRRGGVSYWKKYKDARKRIFRTGYINGTEYISSIVVQFFVALAPTKVRRWIFRNVLRKRAGD